MFGAFTFVGADLHLRFGLSFTLVGLIVGTFAIGGLIYSLSVRVLVTARPERACHRRRRPDGARLCHTRNRAAYWIAPVAILVVGLGFYMLHNTLQTNATQMMPEARGTAVALFSSALYLGQTAGVAAGGVVFDRFTAVPLFLGAAAVLLGLGYWFARRLKQRRDEERRCTASGRARRVRSRPARCGRPRPADCRRART